MHDLRSSNSVPKSGTTPTLEHRLNLFFLVLVVFTFILAPFPASAQQQVQDPKHFMWAAGSPNAPSPNSLGNDLIYHGGNAGPGAIGVENKPAVYLVFWGPDWQNGFTVTDANNAQYTSAQLQTYVTKFLGSVGGSSWAAITTEYCNNAPAGTTDCTQVSGVNYVTTPRRQLKGVWTDTTPVPSEIVTTGLAQNLEDDPIAMEAMRASAHFNYDPQATYVILIPPSAGATGTQAYCGYHTQTTSIDGNGNPYELQYAFIPYLNNGTSCYANSVNPVSDSFGHGVFDSYSIVVGHEYAEAITDPDNFFSVQDGWNDISTMEIGDKCEGSGLSNVHMGNYTFAVQPLWSNRSFDANGQGCVLKAPTSPHIMPPVGIMPPAVDVCQQTVAGVSPCQAPGVAAGQPTPVNMAYFGGGVQTAPRIYLVLWGWGQTGAFDHSSLSNPPHDPDGVGLLMQRFIAAIGGTSWQNVAAQYFQQNSDGSYNTVGNPSRELAGVWWDNSNPVHDNLQPIEIAQEAARGALHFGFKGASGTNVNIVVATPQKFNDAGFNAGNYCAWHDYTTPVAYPGATPGIAFTNMPYILNAGGSCGQDFVNAAPGGNLDGVTIVLGHEIAETFTDPGAEEMVGSMQYGAWFDIQGWEIGDKCAWVGDGQNAVPGAPFNMLGNDGRTYPVQTLWSNQALNGVGYCAGSR
ncbi:MAG: hypothetical protein JO041_11310 [Acidobacteria bacterium]|nr:hypothetical protein [Acidobacteriota bacterium]